jgi:hypothetical protein
MLPNTIRNRRFADELCVLRSTSIFCTVVIKEEKEQERGERERTSSHMMMSTSTFLHSSVSLYFCIL